MSYNHDIKLVGTVTVGPKGQVVIPADVRDSMNIVPGNKLVALYFSDRQSVVFITEEQAQQYVTKMGEQFTKFKQGLNDRGTN